VLQPSTYYHIFNHANGDENLFRSSENYFYFLKKYAHHINPIADTFAYCLMPNHIHFLIRTKDEESLSATFGKFETFQKLSAKLSKQFANLFSSYTQSYNKVYNRRGSLFIPNFKRKEISSNEYFTKLIHYIHANPVHHGFTDNPESWPYSSYQSIISNKKTELKRKEVIEWFGEIEDFIQFHKGAVKTEQKWVIEI